MRRIMYGLALAVTTILAAGAGAQTPVQGPQSGTWGLSGTPYRVTGDVTVASGSSLTIEAGVEVFFDAYCGIGVEGSIHAQGTDGSPVVFAPGTSPDWNGIQISGGDSSSFAYTNLSGSVRGDEAASVHGGALSITGDGTRVTLTSCELSDNSVDGAGGAMFTGDSASVEIDASMFLRNNADGETSDGGGAIFAANDASVTVSGSQFAENTTGGRGGAIRVRNYAWAEITHSDITNNSAWHGGGISVHEAEAYVARTFIVGNEAASIGGGVHGWGPSGFVLENVTIAGNSSTWSGGVGVSGVANVINSIVWGNDPSFGTSDPTPVEYSNWQQGGNVWPGEGNIFADPLFVNPTGGDYAIQPGSPCVDAGSPYGALDADGSRADMGATGGGGADQNLPRIALPPYVVIGEGQSVDLPIRNIGEATLTVDATIPSSFSSATSLPVSIQPGAEALISITYNGTGDVSGVVEISHDDPHRPTPQPVDVHGVGGEIVSGEVFGTWSAANGIHHVVGPVVVPAEQTLTIEGCEFDDVKRGVYAYNGADPTMQVSSPSCWEPGIEAHNKFGSSCIYGLYAVTDSEFKAGESSKGGMANFSRAKAYSGYHVYAYNTGTNNCRYNYWNGGADTYASGEFAYVETANSCGSAFERPARQLEQLLPALVVAINEAAAPAVTGDKAQAVSNLQALAGAQTGARAAMLVLDRISEIAAPVAAVDAVRVVREASTASGVQQATAWVLSRSASEVGDMETASDSYALVREFADNADLVTESRFAEAEVRRLVPGQLAASRVLLREFLEETGADDPNYGIATWRLAQLAGAQEQPEQESEPVAAVASVAAFPNPFNPTTTLSYELTQPGVIRLAVYNMMGQLVETLVDGPRLAGTHAVIWDGTDAAGRMVSSGVYFVRLTANANSEREALVVSVRRVTLLR